MIDATRLALAEVVNGNQLVSNAGLELDRYLPALGDDNAAVKALYDRVCASGPPEIYPPAYERWTGDLKAMNARTRRFKVAGRMIVGLGGESARETSVSLMRPYGVPYIPGSALQGLARHYGEAHGIVAIPGHVLKPVAEGQTLTPEQHAANTHAVLFGNTASAGYVTYLDAWHIPGSAPRCPLRRDVITVHHPDYYRTRGAPGPRGAVNHGPWDFDDPTPVPFLSAIGNYLVAVRAPDDSWAALALNVLEAALGDWGVGAKTSSGYGRMARVPHHFVKTILELTTQNKTVFKRNVSNFMIGDWTTLTDPKDQEDVARAIARRVGQAVETGWMKQQVWYKPHLERHLQTMAAP